MNTRPPTRLFVLLFILITVLEIVGELWPIRWLHYGCKPLIVGLLLAWSWHHRAAGGRPMAILRVGLLFAGRYFSDDSGGGFVCFGAGFVSIDATVLLRRFRDTGCNTTCFAGNDWLNFATICHLCSRVSDGSASRICP